MPGAAGTAASCLRIIPLTSYRPVRQAHFRNMFTAVCFNSCFVFPGKTLFQCKQDILHHICHPRKQAYPGIPLPVQAGSRDPFHCRLTALTSRRLFQGSTGRRPGKRAFAASGLSQNTNKILRPEPPLSISFKIKLFAVFIYKR